MTRENLFQEFYEHNKHLGIDKKKAKNIFDSMIDIISSNIVSGKTLKIREFGTFESRMETFRVPKTQEKINRWKIVFNPSKLLKRRINAEIID